MHLATAPSLALDDATDTDRFDAIEHAIRAFLDGQTDGYALFEALYGETLDEPIPPHLLDLVRKA